MTVSGILKHLHAPPLLPARGEGGGGKNFRKSLLGEKRGLVRNLYFGVGGCYWGRVGSRNFEVKIKTA